jgi:hypothetical protein
MAKPIEISHSQWTKLYEQLHKDYPPSVVLIRSRMKSKLGFTPREYKDYDKNLGKYGGYRKNCVMLDFYSEKKRTFFIMKYSEYINKESVDDNF